MMEDELGGMRLANQLADEVGRRNLPCGKI